MGSRPLSAHTHTLLTIEPVQQSLHERSEWQRKQRQRKHQVKVQEAVYKVEVPRLRA